MMYTINKLFFFIFLLFFTSSLFSQVLLDSLEKYRDDKAAYIKRCERVVINLVNDEPVVESYYELEKILFSEKYQALADEYIFSSYFTDISDVSAELLIAKGNSYKKEKVYDIETIDNFSSNSFYDDSKLTKIYFPHATDNSIMKVKYKETSKTADIFGRFFFSSYLPSAHNTFSVTFPESVKIKHLIYNDKGYKINFSESRKKDMITWEWSCDDVDLIEDESGFTDLYTDPHVILCIESVNGKNFLSSYKDLYKRNIEIIGNPYSEEVSELIPVVDSLCRGKNTQIEKMESIYYFVQKKIKYIAFEDGYSGLIPDKAVNVLKKHYGDCKGKSNLLVQMLRLAGINAYLTWIGTINRPYRYTDIPSPIIDDHMIVTAKINDVYYSLDATASFLHYSLPNSFNQGKECLVGIDSVNCEIFKVPVVGYKTNFEGDLLSINISSDTIKCTGILSLTGYRKVDATEVINKYTDQKKEKVLKYMLDKGYEKAKVDTLKNENLAHYTDTLKIHYNLSVPGYVKKYGDNIYVNMNIERKYEGEKIDTAKMRTNLFYEHAFSEKRRYILEIPEGYEPESIPKNDSLVFDNFGFDIKYSVSGNKIILDEYIFLKDFIVEMKDFNDWNSMIKKITGTYNQSVSLKKKK